MSSISVTICIFSDNNLKRLYLKKKTHFVDFWLHFWNVHEICNILKKNKSILGQLLPKLLDRK